MALNLYLISQSLNNDYDTYDSAVVAAETEELARATHPRSPDVIWDGSQWVWKKTGYAEYNVWAPAHYVSVKYLGVAGPEVVPGVICASFCAG